MHERPVTESIFSIVMEHAAKKDAVRVKKVKIVVGELTGYVEDSIRFYWQALTEGTIAEGAELEVEYVPIKVKCSGCGHEYTAPDQYSMFCPECNFFGGQMMSGKELLVESIEVE